MQQHLLSASQAHIICACLTLSHITLVRPIDVELCISKGEKEGRRSADITLLQRRLEVKLVAGDRGGGAPRCGRVRQSFKVVISAFRGTDTRSSGFPSSFCVMESSCTRSWNLYVSQQTSTGQRWAAASMATAAEPARDMTVPLESTEAAPRNTFEISCMYKNEHSAANSFKTGQDMCSRRQSVLSVPIFHSSQGIQQQPLLYAMGK